MTEIEQKAAELREQIKGGEEKVTALTNEVAELKAKLDASEVKGDNASLEVVELKKSIENIDATLVDLKNENDILRKMESKNVTFVDNFKAVIESEEFKKDLKDVVSGERTKSRKFEVKLDTGDATAPVSRTIIGGIHSATTYPNKFFTNVGSVNIVPQDKNRAGWFDGSYTSSVGYVSEITALGSADTAAIEEKYRELAKVGAKLPFSSEAANDMSFFVNWAKNKGVEAILNKIDDLLYNGEGNDSTKPSEVYGLKANSTAFNATTAGLALSISNANIADLIRATSVQIEVGSLGQFAANAVYLSPANLAKLYMLKNSQADYIQVLPNGSLVVYGIPVYSTTKIGATELLVSDTRTWQLYQKGALETEIERVASSDSYVMYLRWRGNLVVATEDKKGNIYVANIATALTALDSATTTTTTAATTTTTTAG